MTITWDPKYELATFSKGGRFTQIKMSRDDAAAIAYVFDIKLVLTKPGTNIRA